MFVCVCVRLRVRIPMKFVWTICHHDVDIGLSSLMRSVTKHNCMDAQLVDKLRELTREVRMSPHLQRMWKTTLDLACSRASQDSVKSSLLEFAAGIEYARTAPELGSLTFLRRAYAAVKLPALLEQLREFAAQSLKRKEYLHRGAWFELRVRVMDAYALCRAFESKTRVVVYYAGSSHTNVFRDCLERFFGARHVDLKTFDLFDHVDTTTLTHKEVLACQGRVFVLLGEQHNVTSLSFANTLLEYLRTRCLDGEPLTFLIERHIENENDATQQTLMCNVPSLALHRTRCHDMFTARAYSCPKVNLVPVDNRHVDCGFLRGEILDAWDVDDEFRRISQLFQRRAYISVLRFVQHVTRDNVL